MYRSQRRLETNDLFQDPRAFGSNLLSHHPLKRYRSTFRALFLILTCLKGKIALFLCRFVCPWEVCKSAHRRKMYYKHWYSYMKQLFTDALSSMLQVDKTCYCGHPLFKSEDERLENNELLPLLHDHVMILYYCEKIERRVFLFSSLLCTSYISTF